MSTNKVLYSKGDRILVRPKQSRTYQDATIQSISMATNQPEYMVKYDDGSREVVTNLHIKPHAKRESPSRIPRGKSPSRAKKTVDDLEDKEKKKRGKSPSRTKKSDDNDLKVKRRKSPSRAKEVDGDDFTVKRGKSPSRAKKSIDDGHEAPKRGKSPSRVKKIDEDFKESKPLATRAKSPARKSTRTLNKNQLSDDEDCVPLKTRVKAATRAKPKATVLTLSDSEVDQIDELPLRRLKRNEVAPTALVSPLKSERTSIVTRRTLLRLPDGVDESMLKTAPTIKLIDVNKLTEFSEGDDEDIFDDKKRQSPKRSKTPSVSGKKYSELTTGKEFGGTFGLVTTVTIITLLPAAFLLWCDQKTCKWNHFPSLNSLKSQIIDKNGTLYERHVIGFKDASLIYFSILLGNVVLNVLPLGGRVFDSLLLKSGKFTHRCNSLFSASVTLGIVALLEHNNYAVFETIWKRHVYLLGMSLIVASVLAIFAYVRSHYVAVASLNLFASTNSSVYNFLIGREITPRVWGRIDLRHVLLRTSQQLLILILITFIVKSTPGANVSFTYDRIISNQTLLTVVVFGLLQQLQYMVFEEHYLTTFEFTQEGFGYLTAISYAIYPWWATLIPKYIFEHKSQQPTWILASASTLYAIGLVLMHLTTSVKHRYRKNPVDSKLSHLVTIPTAKGKRLIASGYWGFVRHPNYTADLLMAAATSTICGLVPPTLTAFPMLLVFLVVRAQRNNNRCHVKYASAWDNYCEKVPYNLVPYIY